MVIVAWKYLRRTKHVIIKTDRIYLWVGILFVLSDVVYNKNTAEITINSIGVHWLMWDLHKDLLLLDMQICH